MSFSKHLDQFILYLMSFSKHPDQFILYLMV